MKRPARRLMAWMCWRSMKRCMRRCSGPAKGRGPTYIEAITYRFRGHSISDPGTYRSEQEKKIWRERDPIPNFAHWLIEQGHASREKIDGLAAEARETVREAIRFAEESPEPEAEALWTDVYEP